MTYRIKLRRDTAANWASANPILAGGEPGLETDTGKIKYGDGVTAWTLLAYANTHVSNDELVKITVGNTSNWIAQVSRAQSQVNSPKTRYDSQGNVYLATYSNNHGWLTKYSPTGAVLWTVGYENMSIISTDVDRDDNVIVGTTTGDGAIAIIKVNGNNGSEIWAVAYNLTTDPNIDPHVGVDAENNIVIMASNPTMGPYKTIVYKLYGNDGSVAWAKTVDNNNEMYPLGIATDGNSNIYATASFNNGNAWTTWAGKFNKDGTLIWQKEFWPFDDVTFRITDGSIVADTFGNATISFDISARSQGNFEGAVTASATAIVRLNSVGEVQWWRRVGPGPCDSVVSGLACDNEGNAYIAAEMWTPPDGEFNNRSEYELANGQRHLFALAKFNSTGAVVWQRYLSYTGGDLQQSGDNSSITIDTYKDKFVFSADVHERRDSNNLVGYRKVFLVQFPTDGTEQEIGPFSFYESRIPGRLTNQLTMTDSEMNINVVTNSVSNVTFTYTTLEDDLGHELITSESYDFKFDGRGSLVIPNDGEIRLTQNQLGFVNIIGLADNGSDTIDGNCVAVDSEGNSYVAGYDNRVASGYIAKFKPTGDKLWSANLHTNIGQHVRPKSITVYDEYVTVTGYLYDSNNSVDVAFISTHDIDTGREVQDWSGAFRDNGPGSGGMYAIDHFRTVQGLNFVTGIKDSEFKDIGSVTPQAGSGNGLFIGHRSDFPVENYRTVNSNWRVTGTGITTNRIIDYVDRYVGVTATTRGGSGATFNITANGAGGYMVTTTGTTQITFSTSDLAAAAAGTSLTKNADNFVTPGSWGDVWLTIQLGALATAIRANFTNGAVIPMTWGAGSTTTNGYAQVYYNNDGTIQFTAVDVNVNPVAGTWYFPAYFDITAAVGTNYLAGHQIKVLGSNLGGVDGTNDVVITVTSVDGNGAITGLSYTGTSPSGSPSTSNFPQNTNYSSVNFNSGNFTLFSPSGALLTLLQSGVPSGSIITIPASADPAAGERKFALTSTIAYDPMAGGGSGAWTATYTQTSGQAISGGTTEIDITITSTPGPWTGVSGTNYQLGSGATFNLYGNGWTRYQDWSYEVSAGGANYVIGDVLTISGDQLGGSAPGNNVIVTVGHQSGGTILWIGYLTGGNVGDVVKVETNDTTIAFGDPGTWHFWQPQSGDIFISTVPVNFKTFNYGSATSYDEPKQMVKDSHGFAYITGTARVPGLNNGDSIPFVAKFNIETSEHVWSKSIATSPWCNGVSIAINGDTLVTTHYDDDWDDVVSRLDLDGNILWQCGVSGSNSSVAVDNNGDIFVTTVSYTGYGGGTYIYKITPNGECSWRRALTPHSGGLYINSQGRRIVVNDTHIYITGCTSAPSNWAGNGFIAKLAKDGSGTGTHEYWNYSVAAPSWQRFNNTVLHADITSNYVESTTSSTIFEAQSIYTSWMYTEREVLNSFNDTDGGKLVFADGTTQDTSGQFLGQRLTRGGVYTISPEDSGKHILCTQTNSYHRILVPLWQDAKCPVGTKVVVINDTNSNISIVVQRSGQDDFTFVDSFGGEWYYGYDLAQYGMATLINVGINRWYIYGTSNQYGLSLSRTD